MLAEAWTYEITRVCFTAAPNGALNGTLDLTLARDGESVHLRFLDAHEIQIDAGFPHSYRGLEILDVSYLGWEHSTVRVSGFEDAPGIGFWAKSVVRVEDSEL